MCRPIAQGHNAVPPVRLGPVDSRYHYVTALPSELESWGIVISLYIGLLTSSVLSRLVKFCTVTAYSTCAAILSGTRAYQNGYILLCSCLILLCSFITDYVPKVSLSVCESGRVCRDCAQILSMSI